jgi:hypothetical protein
MKRTVDFFIVGAPKCGTTALAEILSQHPSVTISEPKEPHYFSSDLLTGGVMPESDEAYIQRFFPENKSEGTLWGDASVWHMYSEVALQRIKEYNPNARIIVVMRDPARAAFSLHQQMIFFQEEDERDFEKAWRLSDLRFAREEYPVAMKLDPRLVAYRHAYNFYDQVVRLHVHFPAESILMLRQEDFRKNFDKALRQVTDFIGADPFEFDVRTVNETRYIKSAAFAALLRNRNVRRATKILKTALNVKSFGVGRPSEIFRPEFAQLVHDDLSEEIAAMKRDFSVDLIAPSAGSK